MNLKISLPEVEDFGNDILLHSVFQKHTVCTYCTVNMSFPSCVR
uniref:Uncharacterized protein n=1 Tax=Anguilla anguilla TaxID=7936 RepID=A0A0E9RMK2_ANGAN